MLVLFNLSPMPTGFTKKFKVESYSVKIERKKKKKKNANSFHFRSKLKGRGEQDMANLFVYMFGKLKTCKEHSREFLKVSENSFRALFDLYC